MSTPFINRISKSLLGKVRSDLGSNRVEVDASIKNHTWMKVGGSADLLFTAMSIEDIHRAIKIALLYKIPYFVLGGGSNILVRDGGVRGLVIKNRANKIRLLSFKGGVSQGKAGIKSAKLNVESGVIVNQLVRYSIDESLAGLEDFLGLPGTVGGAIYNNAHYSSQLIGDHIYSVDVIDNKGDKKTYPRKDLKFAYDYSILQQTKEVVLSAVFELKFGNKDKLWTRAESVLKNRRDTQPLEKPSSGCMFKNLKTSDSIAFNTPNHTQSAGMLIDKAGLKGLSIGGAEVSSVHANFIVNTGKATARDIEELARVVKDRVKERFGVTLEQEVFFIGEE